MKAGDDALEFPAAGRAENGEALVPAPGLSGIVLRLLDEFLRPARIEDRLEDLHDERALFVAVEWIADQVRGDEPCVRDVGAEQDAVGIGDGERLPAILD